MRVQSKTLPILFLLLRGGISLPLLAQEPRSDSSEPATGFSVVEAPLLNLQKALQEGRVTSREVVLQYLARIATFEDKLNAVITVNPDALEEADVLDRERASGKIRGPLHGIPVALKDNIHTTNMPTTGGALAFDGFVPPYEATLTRHLRAAGAIILAKTGMTELANWVAGHPTSMPDNYNALSGYGMNPYDPRRDPREGSSDGRPALLPGGSSSGIGTAVSFWAANVGSETSGSVLSAANENMLVGIKPTLGRISRYGIMPITADQDTAGPIARTVTGAAILLGVMEGQGPDEKDPATSRCEPPPANDYTHFLKRNGLSGARIGVPRPFYYEKVTPAGTEDTRGGLKPQQAKVMKEALAVLKQQGAVIVDPAPIPSIVDPDPEQNFLLWPICSRVKHVKGKDESCSVVFKYGMKRDFNQWLQTLGPLAPVKSLTELRRWNLAHERAGSIKYGQARLDISDEMDLDADRGRYQADRAKDLALAGSRGIDQVMKAYRLDALLFPGVTGASIAARPGYPTVIVPFGRVPNEPSPPFPEGFEAQPAPFGVSFTGLACSEPRLIEIAYAFEQATHRRVPPPGFR